MWVFAINRMDLNEFKLFFLMYLCVEYRRSGHPRPQGKRGQTPVPDRGPEQGDERDVSGGEEQIEGERVGHGEDVQA